MDSLKRQVPGPESHELVKKKAKVFEAESSEPQKRLERVVLNPGDCDLDFDIEGNGLQGSALYEQGFAYCWSGARANVGITGGKYCFGCRIVSPQPVNMEDTPLDQQHVCRVGISRGDDNVGNLGETDHSFGFGGTGKFSNAGKFLDYGERFGVGDTIVCAVNLESKPLAFISFTKNGKSLGTAKHFDAGPHGLGVVYSPIRQLEWGSALFPHVLLKNVIVEMQFCPEDGLIEAEGYKPWSSALEDGNAIMGPTLSNPSSCEMLMMVALPASGKSTWAEKRIKEHPEKRYVLLGTNLALDRMKVPGLLRKHNYGERFDKLMDRATGIFNILLSRAAKTPHNYILDQTNVYKGARKRKLKPFADYWKVAVVVFPTPEELKSRAEKRFKEMGDKVPAEAVNEMLANYVLPKSKGMPGTDEYFDEVIFTELNRRESQRYLDEMKRALSSGANVAPTSVLPYSCESSVQSYDRSSVQSAQTFPGYSPCGSLSEGSLQRSYFPQPQLQPQPQPQPPPQPLLNYNYERPGQVNSATLGGAPSGRMDPFSVVNQNPHLLSASHVRYGGYDHSLNNSIGSGIVDPGVATDPYRTYRPGGPHRHLKVEDRDFLARGAYVSYQSPMVEPYVRPYGESAGLQMPGGRHFDLHASRQSTFLPASPASYGSTYANPNPRSAYEVPPVDNAQPNRGCFPPPPGYY